MSETIDLSAESQVVGNGLNGHVLEGVKDLVKKRGAREDIRPIGGGFTAVNGDGEGRITGFRPVNQGHHKHLPPSKQHLPWSEPTQSLSKEKSRGRLGFEEAHRELDSQANGIDSNKRKRSDSIGVISPDDVRGDQAVSPASGSPKRACLSIESNEGSTSPDSQGQNRSHGQHFNHMSSPLSPGDRSERAPGPIYPSKENPTERSPEHGRSWDPYDQSKRPEIEAQLAETLIRESRRSDAQDRASLSSSPREDSVGTSYHNSGPTSYPQEQSGETDPKKRKRNFSNRTKTGCHTCRRRKKKCGEEKPECENCRRGGFSCEGYGMKPPIKNVQQGSKAPIPLQAKTWQGHGPAGHFQGAEYTPRPSNDLYDRNPPAPHPQYSTSQQAPYPYPELSRQVAPWPPADAPSYISGYPPAPERLPFPPAPERSYFPPMNTAPSPDVWPARGSMLVQPSYPPAPGSVHSSLSARTAEQALRHPTLSLGAMSEKEKMLAGEPYLHFTNDVLLLERQACRRALVHYNDAAHPLKDVSAEERARLFRKVVVPKLRDRHDDIVPGPEGSIGHRTIIESPFMCDFGYNINVGTDSVIQQGCYMQDPCKITIGNRVLIGPNVRFYGMTAEAYFGFRKGSQGTVMGKQIVIEDDVFIGGDVIILPGRTIKKASVVGAGSVVTEDVQENTIMAGNPLRIIRGIGSIETERDKRPHRLGKGNDSSTADLWRDRAYASSGRPLLGR